MQRINRSIAAALGAIMAGVIGAGLADGALAQTYKWTDANGKIQYSDKPPTDGAAKSVTEVKRSSSIATSPASATDKSARPLTPAEQEQAFRKRQIEGQESAQKQAKADGDRKFREEQCGRARQALAGLEAGGRQVRYDAKGERMFLDDAQIERERGRAKSDVDSLCK